ncbi:MAG: LON peptidase substrate-binding domain-containing protein, partial [Candidatus Cloacimonetes bacterium]|nr:LON peptidase substrate-binding domain-containing protein [Candidatus Cloacimonadota bacterium]
MADTGKRVPEELAIVHVNNIVMFPYLLMPMIVADKKLKKVIDHALNNEKIFGFFLRRDEKDDTIALHETGTAVSIVKMLRNKDGSINLLLQGVARVTLQEITQREPFLRGKVETVSESIEDSSRINALRKVALELLDKIIDDENELSNDLVFGLRSVKEHGRVADIIAGNINLKVEQKQDLLETLSVEKRLEQLNVFLSELIKQMRLENRIRSNIELEMDENQRRYYLHEQLDAIRKELGEDDEVDQELDQWREKIVKAKLPDYVEETAYEELDRLGMMSPASSEYSVIRTYLEWVLNIPWRKYSKDRLDLNKIDQVLTKDHYGLDKPKERILEFIAVKKLKGDTPLKGP